MARLVSVTNEVRSAVWHEWAWWTETDGQNCISICHTSRCIDRGSTGSWGSVEVGVNWPPTFSSGVMECCLTSLHSCINQVLRFSLLTLLPVRYIPVCNVQCSYQNCLAAGSSPQTSTGAHIAPLIPSVLRGRHLASCVVGGLATRSGRADRRLNSTVKHLPLSVQCAGRYKRYRLEM